MFHVTNIPPTHPLRKIVFFFTLALFLSGYTIQQRTLREIRASINRPKPSPKIFLPDRFKQSTTELEDGTIVIIEDENISRPPRPLKEILLEEEKEKELEREREVVISVVPTVPTEEEVLAEKKQVEEKEKKEGGLLGWMRTGKKAEKKTEGDDGEQEGEDGEEGPQKPISRAERRKRIKEELMRLAQGEERGWYQRRLY
ncbi:uncharacterized protein PODANS_1_17220 [Podospora anserina S mat+]|uniref:Podospora anserina S mat+ genomic DNA chromosome 1, supercontig 4 n=1 Tax=Podospora anserina (strain S / ATCC MYA-4624 / DSM 980 / FGSC 10383) TaxID=515849 RepID=B2ATW9_PODAN|nr:uncharacterized protein PODANS_1_17220 [Podospora anserina S mat+]CAP67842.1 unnamed protein product [Podospora anserina S mat+]CDP24101.1 Putative protein of unknown function [Podospora anserina S mat+]